MKWKTLTGKVKNIAGAHNYLVDWTGKQGSEFSAEVLDLLEPYWKRDIVFAELPVIGPGRMRFDYVNITKKIIAEVDGRQHHSYVAHFAKGSRLNYQAQIQRDLYKDQIAEKNDFQMVRIKPDDLPKIRVNIKAWFLATYDIHL